MTDPTIAAAEALADALERAARDAEERGVALKAEGERLLGLVGGLRERAALLRGGFEALSEATALLQGAAPVMAPPAQPVAPKVEPDKAPEPEAPEPAKAPVEPPPVEPPPVEPAKAPIERVKEEVRGRGHFPPPLSPAVEAQVALRQENIGRIGRFVASKGVNGARLQEIYESLGISQTAVSRALRTLMESGDVVKRPVEGDRFQRYFASAASPGASAPPPPPRSGERAAPQYPGAEALPEPLRMFPAASHNIPVATRLPVAEQQKLIYDFVNSRPTTIAGEVEKGITFRGGPIPQQRISNHLRTLEEAGLIRRTGRNRLPLDRKPGVAGRASVEYAPLKAPAPASEPAPRERRWQDVDRDLKRATEPEPEPEPAPAPAPEPGVTRAQFDRDLDRATDRMQVVSRVTQAASGAEARALNTVRDYATKQKGGVLFSDGQAAEATELPRAVVLACLEKLADQGVVSDESVGGDMRLFTYKKPTSPGKAAEMDMERRKAQTPPPSATAPVAGTGRGLRIADAGMRNLLEQAMRQGANVNHAPNGHYSVSYDGQTISVSGTPRNPRTVMNERTRLRRLGLTIT
jgi:DNA-binding HxlR family transcriptional regulator